MREEYLVDSWCEEINLENEGWLNKGGNGNAYTISDNKVIKITSDYNEFISTYKISNSNNPNLPKIYNMRVFPNGELGILMEKLVTDDIEELYSQAEFISQNQGVYSILDIEIEDIQEEEPELIKFIEDIIQSQYMYQLEGVNDFDIQPDNMGLNTEGNYILFDQTKKDAIDYDQDIFRDIEEKLREDYIIDSDNPIKKSISIEKLMVDKDVLHSTYKDIYNKKYAQSKEPIECQYTNKGMLQIIDGNHRYFEALLTNKEEIEIIITYDERCGYDNPNYKTLEDNNFEADIDKLYSGLEFEFDEETLAYMYEDYIGQQKKELLNIVSNKKVFYHSTFDDFEEFDFTKSDFGMHFGTKESAMNRIEVKIREDNFQGGFVLKNKKDNPILLEVELDYKNPLKLKENRTGAWLPYDIVREVIEQAEKEDLKGITDKEIDDYYQDELNHNDILFVDVGDEEEYDGEMYSQEIKEHYFVRNWLESKGYDAIIYENEFEKGGESIIVFRKEQIEIKNKTLLNPKPDQKKKIKRQL